ncbi:UNVERIFIED_CONTAM: hypothetical protein PYX00_000637 [Menopon gallinae]|uniref:Pikachurin n=1 Tax=Menopon gallinae TaxID=328185 RepID=A0AAW2I9T9_9NEOP
MNTTVETFAKEEDEEDNDILYQKDASISAELDTGDGGGVETSSPDADAKYSTTQSPNLEQKVPFRSGTQGYTESLRATDVSPCTLDCGIGGVCVVEGNAQRCQCPLGRGGDSCENDVLIRSPRFTGQGWLAFPALQAAYKHVQLEMVFRPEAWDGILFLTGERDDMTGDFMSLLLHRGFLEFRFDCGSGIGVVRSEETVVLNEWNRLVLYRHRWDAWIQLNNGKHVQGRSKGLFSRITFREPVFIGGPGNTTGLADKLPIEVGLKGCIRHLEINDHSYSFELSPEGDSVKGFDVVECTSDRCSKVPCQHSGKCLMNGEEAVCLCPLGFTGDLCQTRVDLQVPSFNGSSYLRYPGLGSSVLSWLDIQVTLKPTAEDGIILYNGHRTDGVGDFMAIYILGGHLEFTFDLGTGSVTIRLEKPVSMGEWHELRLSRTGRLAILQVDNQSPVHALAPGAFTQLSLPQNLYIGGVPNFDMVSPKVKVRTSFVGCIQKVVINDKPLQILAEALAGVNVANCPHPCVAQPCGTGKCIPVFEYFTCQCPEGYTDRECQDHGVPVLLGDLAVPRFSGSSYLHYSDPNIMRRLVSKQMKINVRLKTDAEDGLILWTGDREMTHSSDFLSLGLQNGIVHLRFNLGGGEVDIAYNRSSLADNEWHEIRASRSEYTGQLAVDGGPAIVRTVPGKLTQLNTNSGLYVGGMENVAEGTLHKYTSGLVGCISRLVFDSDFDVKLIPMSTAGRNVKRCD